MSKTQIQGLNGSTSTPDDLKTVPDGDAQATQATGLLAALIRNCGFNGTTWDRLRTASAAVLAGATQPFALLATRPGDWSVTSSPAVNTVATASKAAGGAGVRHICTSVSARVLGGSTAPTAIVGVINLRDGATGAGAILMSWTTSLAAAVGAKDEINLTGLNIVGAANTAMTLEFAAAGGANTFESANIGGYSVS